jgi:hypothetical protein
VLSPDNKVHRNQLGPRRPPPRHCLRDGDTSAVPGTGVWSGCGIPSPRRAAGGGVMTTGAVPVPRADDVPNKTAHEFPVTTSTQNAMK